MVGGCRFATGKDGRRRTLRLEMLAEHRMHGNLTGVSVVKAKLAQAQCDAVLLTFRWAPAAPSKSPCGPFSVGSCFS